MSEIKRPSPSPRTCHINSLSIAAPMFGPGAEHVQYLVCTRAADMLTCCHCERIWLIVVSLQTVRVHTDRLTLQAFTLQQKQLLNSEFLLGTVAISFCQGMTCALLDQSTCIMYSNLKGHWGLKSISSGEL